MSAVPSRAVPSRDVPGRVAARRWLAAVASVALLALTGCGGLSTRSGVQPGLDVGADLESEVRVEASPVAPGSSPEQIVTGFIRAAAASDDQYQVARSHLAPGPQTTWKPDSSVVVFTADSALTVKASSPDTVSAVARATARIDGDGRYQELPTNTSVQVEFGLGKVGGEWRVTSVPEGFGTWLSESDLDRLYDPFRIYFMSTTERRLVPDVRWFPLGTGLATRLARSLLAGVPPYLVGAVRTDVPQGTRLAVDAVTIDSGEATVDLTATRLGSDPGQRQNLAAQFLATVTQAPGVDRVALQLEGADLQVPGVGGNTVQSLSALGLGTTSDPTVKPVLRTGTTLTPVDPDQLGDPESSSPAAPGVPLPTVQPGWAYLAMSRTGREVAGVGGDRAQLARWRDGRQVQVLTFGSELTRPTYDRQDRLWVGGRDRGAGRIWVLDTAVDPVRSRPVAVDAAWLAKRSVRSLRLSPDGQRIVVVTTRPGGSDPRVAVAGVVRQPDGRPVRLVEPLTLAPGLTLVRDAVWVDDSTLAALGRKTPTQVLRPWFVPLGGPLTAGPGLAGARTITTVNAERGLVVTTDDGHVHIRAGNRWQRVGKGTDLLTPAR